MSVQLSDVVTDGVSRVLTRTGVILFFMLFILQLLATILTTTLTQTMLSATAASLVSTELLVAVFLAVFFLVVMSRAFTRPVAELATFPRELYTRRIGRATLSAFVAGIVVSVSVRLGPILLAVPAVSDPVSALMELIFVAPVGIILILLSILSLIVQIVPGVAAPVSVLFFPRPVFIVVPIILGILSLVLSIGLAVFVVLSSSFYPFAVGVEDRGVVGSLRRSWELSRGNRLKLLGPLYPLVIVTAIGVISSSTDGLFRLSIFHTVLMLFDSVLILLSGGMVAAVYRQLTEPTTSQH